MEARWAHNPKDQFDSETTQHESCSMKKLKVFLVEDNPDLRSAISAIIVDSLPDVIEIVGEADNELDAKEFLQANEIDVLLIDIMLKTGNGLQVLRDSLPVKSGKWIVFSGHNRRDLEEMCLESGADHVFDKSNDVDSLVQLLGRLAGLTFD